MIDKSQTQQLIGAELRAGDGTKVGTIGQVYLDDYYDEPEWVTVNTGLFGTNESFVPLSEARADSGVVTVPYTKDKIKNAPNIDDSGHLTEAEERNLYDYYEIGYTTEGSTFAQSGVSGASGGRHAERDTTGDTDTARVSDRFTDRDADGNTHGTAGHDTSGPTTDDAMTRSEEQLRVGTEQVEAGRARLRKYVVTENVSQTVPVKHEEVRLEREPITDANRPAALDGPDISEEEHEVTLTGERVVVSKEAVPVERVRLDKETVTEEQRVDESVRKEQIEMDGVDGVDTDQDRTRR